MLWEHEPQASVSTAFSSSPKLSRLRDEKTGKQLVNYDYQNVNHFARAITTSTARASSVSPSSYTNTIFNQSARVLS